MTKLISKSALYQWARFLLGVLHCFVFAYAVLRGPVISEGTAMAQSVSLNNLAPSGWKRDEGLTGIKIDRYVTESGTLSVDLIAFPATDQNAKTWSEHFINVLLKEDRTAGHTVKVLNEDDINTGTAINTSEPGLDTSSHTLLVLRPKPGKNLHLALRTIIREGQPVQVSLRRLHKGKASKAEVQQASKIAYDARLPVNDGAAALGLDAMIDLMTSRLFNYEAMAMKTTASKTKAVTNIASSKSALKKAAAAKVVTSNADLGSAPLLVNIPGPQKKRTGKMLGQLPAGYRMHIWTTNYWTNKNMTSTRMLHLHLTKEGQFEKGSFAIAGSGGGQIGVITSKDKTGSTGSVLGSTTLGQQSGAQSVFLKKRDGLDPKMYGTYYISGNQIELRYATGETTKQSFQTDGFSTLDLDDKKYFAAAPKGWELYKGDKANIYRDLDGDYIARVSRISGAVPDGKARMQSMITNGKKKNLIKSAGPITQVQAGRHKAVKSTMVFKGASGAWQTRDVYIRYGKNSSISRLIRVKHFKGDQDNKKLLSFIEDL